MLPHVVVTGASGFVGSHLADTLLAQGFAVDAITRKLRNPESRVSDVTWIEAPDYAQVDVPSGAFVVHLAEAADVDAYTQDERLGMRQLAKLKALLASSAGRLVYVSSAAVYGDLDSHPHKTDEDPRPTTAYGRAKLACEIATLASGGIVVRPSNLYGPGMSKRNVLSDILRQTNSEGPIRIRDVNPVRDYLWVGDFAAGIVQAVKHKARGLYNFGSGVGISVAGLIDTICSVSGQVGREVEVASHGNSGSVLLVDIAQTCVDLSWSPATDLRAGIAQLLLSRDES